ncbi:MAG: hypothetical protein SYNGOMJ08_00460 [Candidatus Syntrophoarchaeum sp. GoM_oil]|nr:MAG: hypothetical protein SYNGOMJ08_00460 [Candidatus Syntrophoarchaeum sp. GoM_oil]
MNNEEPLKSDKIIRLLEGELKSKGSKVYPKIPYIKGDISGRRRYIFTTQPNMLEIQKDNTIIGYEVEGYKKRKGEYEPPAVYEGLDKALAYLGNPAIEEAGGEAVFRGGVFDYVYLVHGGDDNDKTMSEVIDKCTPIGFILVSYDDITEVVEPKKNPFVNDGVKKIFLDEYQH